MGVIYKITSPTGRLYIGKTYHLAGRIASYKHDLKKERYTTVLFHSLKKYGWDAHKLEVIEDLADELLEEREIFWIAELKTYRPENENGMNMTHGGEGHRGTWMHDLARRKHMSETFRGSNASFYGKHHTEENKKKASIRVSAYNKKHGIKVPQWGAEKGWEKTRKVVIAYNSKGKFSGEFISLTKAAEQLNVKLQGVKDSVLYNSWVDGRFIFKYKTDNYPPTIEVGGIKVKTEKRPVLFLNEDYEVMAEYPSALEASIELQVPKTSINRAAMYNWLQPLRTGHIFIYKDLYEQLNLN